ncbi:hypothetical protein D3P08_23755 [Paenibacillus nanensis]|uniref:Uncharacterized protein n=1 Tax=Paenibacillus nanensis TaxID=393251 RepID=A0A3A1UW74_9BACL|nr:hypothetical protein [Paenibacillus nanensis]RIX48715.1 hypothetical protein D3P08_23755 [Paenibacillus nanensis]
MQIVFGQPVNMVHLAGVLAGWCIVLYLTIRQYRKLPKKPVVWKMVIVVWVGLFAFNLNLPMFGQTAKLSILPLGVWILYLFFRKRSWDAYRRFAWLGFAANYLFLIVTLLSGAAHQAIYDKRDPSTYLADVGKAEIIGIHPSAQAVVWDPSEFASLLDTLQIGDMSDSADWYYQSKFEHEPYYQHERFPYALVGAKPSWGSGLRAVVYIEMDGKGLLIAAADRSYYFRSEKPLINGEAVES